MDQTGGVTVDSGFDAAPGAPDPEADPDPVTRAQRIADEVLFPHALVTDRAGVVPVTMLDRLAEADLFGLQSAGVQGRSSVDTGTKLAVLEALASGCLTTAFVWSQHGGAAGASAKATGPVHDRWATDLASGAKRGGVAFAYLLRPGVPMMVAEPTADGWSFSGRAPFVTGWGYLDALLIAGRHGDDIVWAVIDAAESPTMTSRRLELAAVDSSVTVELHVNNHLVSADEVTAVQPFDDWMTGYRHRLRDNGSLSLGVTRRALQLLGPSALDDELAQCRLRLDTSPQDEMPAARAATTALGVRATAALVASVGGGGMAMAHHAQRLAREALFLLVQGQTGEIREEHLKLFSG